jgi:hypothetical protein
VVELRTSDSSEERADSDEDFSCNWETRDVSLSFKAWSSSDRS